MKKMLLVLSTMLMTMVAAAAYQNGDQVADFTWLDSDGGAPVSRKVSEIIGQDKVLLLSWGYKGCQYCAQEAPKLDAIYKDPKYAGKVHFSWGSTNDNSWTSLNGTGWRTYINPPITYNVSIKSELADKQAAAFGVEGVPHIALIGLNRTLYATHVGYSAATFSAALRADLDKMIDVYAGGIMEAAPVASFTLMYGANTTKDVSNVFMSKNALTISVQSISNPAAVTASLNGNILTVNATNAGPEGKVTIVLKAEANGKTATSNVEVNVKDPNSAWLEWGATYNMDPDAVGMASAPWKAGSDFDMGSTPTKIDQIEVGFSKAESNVKWKFVAVEASGKPTTTVIGSLSGTYNSIANTPVTIDINNTTEISGKFALVIESTTGNFMAMDRAGSSDHTWAYAGSGPWDLLTNLAAQFTGAWQIRVKKAGVGIDAVDILPGSSELFQNYPNPFNPETSISFINNMDGNVKLAIFNAKGEEVKTVVNSYLKAAKHSYTFNAIGLESGVYFYKLITPTATLNKKMLLVK